MKIYAMLMMLLATAAFADEAPKYMRDGNITVTLKDGKKAEFSLNEYMVVPRKPKKKAVPVPTVVDSGAKEKKAEGTEVAGPNAIKVYGGGGPKGLEVKKSASSVAVEQDYGAVFGLGYSRQLNKRWSLEAVGLSNKTGLLGVGLSF